MTALAADVGYATNHGEYVEACSQVDPELMFAEDPAGIAAAKQVCGRCFFRDACLAKALQRKDPWGVWGGLSAEERRPLVKKAEAADRRRRRALAAGRTQDEVLFA